jgi:hypothetical protein
MIFNVSRKPDSELLHELYFLSGENCHLNPGILKANSAKGTTLLVLSVSQERQTLAFGVARESNRWFARRIVFQRLPQFIDKSEKVVNCFWRGLQEYCQNRRVLQLDLNAFNSQPIEVPNLSSIAKTTNRQEYIIDLRQLPENRKKGLSSNHRRNIKKAERAGLSYQIRNNFEACKDHSRLMAHSMHRRKSRGQSVHYRGSPQKLFNYVQCKAGFIIQAKHDNDWVSSLLIFRSSHQAYYVSGGTSPRGMQLGAAHYLMWKAIQYLSSKGVSILNLGGVSETDTPGLARFKAGFTAKPIELPHRSYITGSLWRYRVVRALHMLKSRLRTLDKEQLKR